MTEFKNLLVFDLTKLGAAYQIINSFVDDEVVHVFEVSPLGTSAVLILASNDIITLKFIEKECQAFFKSDILNMAFLENVDEKIIEAYLSQNQTAVQKHLAIVEENSFAGAFQVANHALKQGIHIVDFRVVRTSIPNLILTLTSDSIEILSQLAQPQQLLKLTVIENSQKPLKSYFEILT
ncbi:MAG: hypothetical protein H7256_05755 [Bdellovibrio sp.]|nr:hypothetical protein [Bdellovibrio sp.]